MEFHCSTTTIPRSVPTILLFVGCREANYPEIKRLFPAVEIRHVKDAGHWVHSEKPYVFMDMVTEFMKDS